MKISVTAVNAAELIDAAIELNHKFLYRRPSCKRFKFEPSSEYPETISVTIETGCPDQAIDWLQSGFLRRLEGLETEGRVCERVRIDRRDRVVNAEVW